MSRPRVAAGALFFDEQGDVLLVKPTYKEGWEIPGGYVEPGETPREACEREIKEELGLDCVVGQLLVVDWAPSESEGDKVLFIFDAGEISDDLTGRLRLQRDQLSACAFQSPDIFEELMPARLARRVAAAARSRKDGTVKYLEHGQAV